MTKPQLASPSTLDGSSTDYGDYQVIRRNGTVVEFQPSKIAVAMTKAFLAVRGDKGLASESMRQIIQGLTHEVVEALLRSRPQGGTFHIEDIQDRVELCLMRNSHHEVARAYVLYREKQAELRLKGEGKHGVATNTPPQLSMIDGKKRLPLDTNTLRQMVLPACKGLDPAIDPDTLIQETLHNVYDGIPIAEVYKALIMAARAHIEKEPDYQLVAARLLLDTIRTEVLGNPTPDTKMDTEYPKLLLIALQRGVDAGLLNPELLKFDLESLGQALKPDRDFQFNYLGLQTLYDRYFLHIENRRIELPQIFFMRVAMGLALREAEREKRAIEFYNVLSSFDFMSSTPTLFNSGTLRPQLSSCYLSTTPDHLDGIYGLIKENALLSKFAGGLGNDWTSVRALGSHIKGTNGKSQGVVPFLKVVNDTAVAVNQGGKRKGAVCTYLETWHLDIEEFLELRKNTGDDRRRTHDMNTANWVPDLFMERVMEGGDWTLFSPSDVPDLHGLYGPAFKKAYCAYEEKVKTGERKLYKTIPAIQLWRKMLSMLFETGHPWITFKDACNIRSPQQHIGVVHSSNLCTEITLNTSDTETAVCNLGSINLRQHLKDGQLDSLKLKKTITTAMRMLDNVIDINFYPVEKARVSNLRHRPVGMGIMAFQDALYALRIPYASQEAVTFADHTMEEICYYAYWASSDLAKERGTYTSYEGSLWQQGMMPLDTLNWLAQSRGDSAYVEVDRSQRLDWDAVRQKIKRDGMRNSNCIAIAPTATIANIVGVEASIEPCFGNLSVKSNLSGEFTIINKSLVQDLKSLDLWDEVMVMDLKHFDGSLSAIERIPKDIKALYATAFEIDPTWLVEAAARRQKWIDQAQSLNIYMAGASGKKLDEIYKLVWLRGLKTTYYLRTKGATHVEKSTVQNNHLNAVQSSASVKVCAIDDPDCEACQ